MHAARRAAFQGRVVVCRVDTLLVEHMSALMQHGVDVAQDVILMHMSGDDAVVGRESVRKRVLGVREEKRCRVDALQPR